MKRRVVLVVVKPIITAHGFIRLGHEPPQTHGKSHGVQEHGDWLEDVNV